MRCWLEICSGLLFFSFLFINRARLRNWHEMKNKSLIMGENMESVAYLHTLIMTK